MNYSYVFKQLSGHDVGLLKALLRVFGEAFNEIETYQRAVPSDEYLGALLSRPHFIALVAMSEEVVVGGLAAYELDKFEQERREIYIYDLAVSEQHRRRHVATNLIRRLQALAAERGAYVIYVQADPYDEPAVRLYESLGTREEVYHFDIPIEM